MGGADFRDKARKHMRIDGVFVSTAVASDARTEMVKVRDGSTLL